MNKVSCTVLIIMMSLLYHVPRRCRAGGFLHSKKNRRAIAAAAAAVDNKNTASSCFWPGSSLRQSSSCCDNNNESIRRLAARQQRRYYAFEQRVEQTEVYRPVPLRLTGWRSRNRTIEATHPIRPAAYYRASSSSSTRLRSSSSSSSSIREEDEEHSYSYSPTLEEAQMTGHCLEIANAAIGAVDPVRAVQRHVRWLDNSDNDGDDHLVLRMGTDSYNMKDYDNIVLTGFGKASSAMATAVLDILLQKQQPLSSSSSLTGLIICKDGHATEVERARLEAHDIRVMFAAHPVPDARGVEASNAVMDLVHRTASPRTLVVVVVSGGGSALFCTPSPGLTVDDLQVANTALLGAGWNIRDMNTVRKKLEQGKGGGLALRAYPSTVTSLILSDVLGDPLDLIASGPTVRDRSTMRDAWNLIRTQLPQQQRDSFPTAAIKLLEEGAAAAAANEEEEGKIDHEDEVAPASSSVASSCSHCRYVLVGNNAAAVYAAALCAETLGYSPIVLTTQLEGEAKEVAQVLVALAHQLRTAANNNDDDNDDASSFAMTKKFPVALIAGGETTVSLPPASEHHGLGGRNQELALAAAIALERMGLRQVVLAAVGTDGNDGPTDAAGAIVDGGTVRRMMSMPSSTGSSSAAAAAQRALREHDAYTYLDQVDSATGCSPLVKTGPTGTNVADICVILIHSS